MNGDSLRKAACVSLVSVALHLGHAPYVPMNRREEDAPGNEPVQATDIGMTMMYAANTTSGRIGFNMHEAGHAVVAMRYATR